MISPFVKNPNLGSKFGVKHSDLIALWTLGDPPIIVSSFSLNNLLRYSVIVRIKHKANIVPVDHISHTFYQVNRIVLYTHRCPRRMKTHAARRSGYV